MALKFEKHVQKKSYQYVVEQIQDAIINEDIKVGDRLPSEYKLKEMFDTSRGTVREALRVLEQKGLVSIKTGVKGGATIKKAGTKPIGEGLGLLIQQQQVSLDSLAQFRILLEGFVAEQAAINASDRDIRNLEAIVKKAEKHISTRPDSFDTYNALDAQFHRELAKICNNPLVEVNLNTIHDNIQTYFHDYLKFSPQLLKEDYQDLSDMLCAIKQRNPELARMLAQGHVKRFNRAMQENLDANDA